MMSNFGALLQGPTHFAVIAGLVCGVLDVRRDYRASLFEAQGDRPDSSGQARPF
jgi:hypothetical protein